MERLRVLNLTGIFYLQDSNTPYVVDEATGATPVDMSYYVGKKVQVVAHHFPPEPPSRELWGGGCCYYQTSYEGATCPFGHHANPNSLYELSVSGILRHEGDDYVVETEDGIKHEIRLDYLIGHRSRLLIINQPDFQKMQEEVNSFNPDNFQDASLDVLLDKLQGLKEYISDLQGLAKDSDE
jgi:hypothetical protein